MAVATHFSFLTIRTAKENLYKEKGSKFIAFVFPVKDENEIKIHLDELRKKYFDATHHCYAWTLGADKKHFRVFDDGEPNHSAGTPILGQIRSKNLTNILIVVVRYFGGTKLGVGGLTQAYKIAAEQVLNETEIIEIELTTSYILEYDYTASPEVMRLVKDFDLTIINQTYNDQAKMEAQVKLRLKEKLEEKLKLLKAMKTNIQFSTAQ